jgi:tetratricopeptide (TPR) repeat protein
LGRAVRSRHGDLFALQNEITGRIANTLGIELIAAQAARPTERPEALDYILRGRAAGLVPASRDVYAEAISLFEQALAVDPQSAEAQTYLAGVLVNRVSALMTDSAAADLARAERLVGQALVASPRSAFAHSVKGTVLRVTNRWEDAIPEFETALRLNPNLAAALQGLGFSKLYAGSIEEVIPLAQQTIRLNPRDPTIGYRYQLIGTVHLLQSRTDEAIVWFEKGRSATPAVPGLRICLASAYALRGETERAPAELAEARRLGGEGSLSSIAGLKAIGVWGVPEIRALYEATYFVGCARPGCRRTDRHCRFTMIRLTLRTSLDLEPIGPMGRSPSPGPCQFGRPVDVVVKSSAAIVRWILAQVSSVSQSPRPRMRST